VPITYTGRSVRPGSTAYPSLVDIAVGIFRQPRFAGQGKRWLSVGDHSLFADELVKASIPNGVPVIGSDDEDAARNWRLAVLLHDAHEAITADVPSDFKDETLKARQGELDIGIANAFYPGGWHSYYFGDVKDAIKHIDRRALAAEAQVIGPPVDKERILHAFGVTEDTHEDVKLLEQLLFANNRWFGAPPLAARQELHPGVREYLNRLMELL
jgi:hypothetical protein